MNLLSKRIITGAVLLTVSSLLTLTACETKPVVEPDNSTTTPTDEGNKAGKAGFLTGTVTDPQGKPLARATVFIDNTVFKGRGAEVNSTTNGTYQVQLVKDLGQWIAKGYILKQYNDRVYKINLEAENPDSFTEAEKPIRNFQWKLTGHIPDLSLDLYYGGTVETFRDLNADELRDNENIEFTFKPVGPLIDGSTGKTLSLRSKKRYDSFIKDVPIGRYVVTAAYKPTGKSLKVRDVYEDGDYATSITVDFVGRESATRSNMMGIGYTNQ
ncbi:carboxypeptidase regulatory-like domain-containing protein [Spirosoma sp. BT702]|uniref:Carboxypeptidase regulatory-like domain-containing protein n=1 Tax=Spirosoma profusum TaxID=2771354 RepID=A0A927AT00_9BACT|nr:carboxypeptidase-like regulatory domain-containing protein [Spirosoma profusum]MBD2702150.1 carboxypeptidase regulatory-like domain-containing protein [Spirosoma profusum]